MKSDNKKNNTADKPWLFQKGQSGNPNGKPKGTLVSKRTKLAHLFVDKAGEEWPALINTLFDMAKDKNIRAIALIFDYAVIKPVSTHVIDDRTSQEGCEKTKEELLAIINS
ncbi:MAG: DUF5681 domain-containing protein [Silvibacterium sp.]